MGDKFKKSMGWLTWIVLLSVVFNLGLKGFHSKHMYWALLIILASVVFLLFVFRFLYKENGHRES